MPEKIMQEERLTDKDLRAMHPLYKRLSGESLWLLLEDNGFSQKTIDALMDKFLSEMQSVLKTMRHILKNNTNWLVLEILEGTKICSTCSKFDGLLIPATNPEILNFIPPFGIGCPVTCRTISQKEAESRLKLEGNKNRISLETLPKHSLCCPTFFDAPECLL